MPRAVICLNSGRVQGLSLGHLYRCIYLYEYILKDLYISVVFVGRFCRDSQIILKKKKLEYVILDFLNDQTSFTKFLANENPLLLVFDTHEVIKIPLERYHGLFRTIVINDYSQDLKIRADIIICNDLNPKNIERVRKSAEGKFFSGIDNILISEQFHNISHKSKRSITFMAEKPTVCISFGGSDPNNLLGRMVPFVRTMSESFKLKIIIGPGYNDQDIIDDLLASQMKYDFDLWFSPDDLVEFFADADFVVCAGGRTLLEALSASIPTIVIASIDHEVACAEMLSSSGCCIYGGYWTDNDIAYKIQNLLMGLKLDARKCRDLRETCKKMFTHSNKEPLKIAVKDLLEQVR